jgi:hypothetical protein
MQAWTSNLWSLLWTILIRWVIAVVELFAWLMAWLRVTADRSQLKNREGKGADSTCIPIRHPSFRKPDPLIYAQYYLMDMGLAVTWDNPDIDLRRAGVAVPSSNIEPDADYEIVARVWNASTTAPVVGLPVEFSYLSFGIGLTPHTIGTTKVDLGVKGGPGCPTFASIPWHTPSTPGHYCIQVNFTWIDDANPLNNLGQKNLEVGKAHSPARFDFSLRNSSDEQRVFTFEVDTYELPAPLPCDEVQRPTRRQQLRRSVEPASARLFPALPERVRAMHERAAYQVDPGWVVAFDRSEVPLGAGNESTVEVLIEPPAGFRGTRRFNVRAVDGQYVQGGVTLVVEAD